MRGIGLIAAMALLTGCGNRDGGNEAAANAGQRADSPSAASENATVVGNTAEAAEHAAGSLSPCLMQGEQRLEVSPIRAVGTEPFWSARIEGRCVTYSTPEDQQGTRVWTRYSAGSGGGLWVGQLGGKDFELRTRPEPGCSDGMSDKSYPIEVALTVNGEQRRGCAEPL